MGESNPKVYTRDMLFAYNHARPPNRHVRRTLLLLFLWMPRWQRQANKLNQTRHNTELRQETAPSLSKSKTKPASDVISIGWLNVQSLANKTTAVRELLDDRHYDVFAASETWHRETDDISLRLVCGTDYSVSEKSRDKRKGGGVAIFYRSHYKTTTIKVPITTTFESVCTSINTGDSSFIVLAVYRPGSESPTQQFFDELTAVLEELVLHPIPVIIGGDFNIHMQEVTDLDTKRFQEILCTFGLVQKVTGPTHRAQSTLDLVVTFDDGLIVDVAVDPPSIISDHSCITSILNLPRGMTPVTHRLVRSWRKVDRSQFSKAILDSPLGKVPKDCTVADMVDTYNNTLLELADRFAPRHIIQAKRQPLTPWLDEQCRTSRRTCRRLERRYRRTQNDTDRARWKDEMKSKVDLFQTKKDEYWVRRIQDEGKSTTKLWRSVSQLLARNTTTKQDLTELTADSFADFFQEKVDKIRNSTSEDLQLGAEFTGENIKRKVNELNEFTAITDDELRRIIMGSPTKSSDQDPIPTFLLKEMLDVLLPYIKAIVNASLKQASVPVSQKLSIVTPKLKKQNIDANTMSNYRPIANLPFLSKIIEKSVVNQLRRHLDENHLLPTAQSAYRRNHSTETALLRILSDVYEAADDGKVTSLVLLDLSAAFDCVDHNILYRRLQQRFGLCGSALGWIKSYLTNRSMQVRYGGKLSRSRDVHCGVPQGSILGPLLFVMFISELEDVVSKYELQKHFYADDIQLYLSCDPAKLQESVKTLTTCIEDVEKWLNRNRLKLNGTKTEFIILGHSRQVAKVNIDTLNFGDVTIKRSISVRNLGVIIDQNLTMADQISKVVSGSFHQLRQLHTVVHSLTTDAAKTLVHALVSTRLDYCNGLLAHITEKQLRRLQVVQNSAARLITGTRRGQHITPVLRNLHWLPVKQRTAFKIASLVDKCLRAEAPEYLARDCQLLSDRHRSIRTRSDSTRALDVPRTRTKFGDRSFRALGATQWNALPPALRDGNMTRSTFLAHLKTYLFKSAEAH